MIEKFFSGSKNHREETVKRSIVKTISYRIIILILDFDFIYLFTGKIKVAIGFMTIGYFFHERIWDGIKYRIKKIIFFLIY